MSQATSAEIASVVEGQTIPTAFLETIDNHADLTAIRWRNEDDTWGEWTFRDYADQVAAVVAGLRAKGIGPGDRVVAMLRNIPEFHVFDMAAYFLGATPISIYSSSAPDQIAYLVGHCEAKLALVEDVGFLERLLKVRGELPALEHIGILRDPEGLAPDGVFGWEDLTSAGSADLAVEAQTASPQDLATVIYTSGTTGPPKGVMISHFNVCWTVESLKRSVARHPDFEEFVGKRLISYLPMAHIAERMVSHYQQAFLGYEVTTCPDPAQIGQYLVATRPNFLFGVPRVFEKLHAGVTAAIGADPEKGEKFAEAVEAATPIVNRRDAGEATEEELQTLAFLDEVAFKGVREVIGLDQCELAITGAAPIPAELLVWFRVIGVDLTEVYGMSENTGPMTYTPVDIMAGTVGPAVPGAEVTLADDGEIICRGGLVFQGYLNNPEKTAEALDEDGWLHTGDIGEVGENGYFTIVDRKKELIITAGGKNISPANLEASLKLIDIVGQACAIGDQRKFVSALVVLDPDVAPAWAQAEGIEFTDLGDLARRDEVRDAIERQLVEVMADFNNAEKVKKVHVIGEEWLPDSDVLTPTSKLKRRGIHQRYDDEIEALYA